MNERIKQLAEQAAKFSAVMALPTGESGDRLFVERFAELIVRECVKSTIALQNTAIDNEWHLDETFHIIVDDIVEQFDMQYIFRSEE